MLRKPTAVTHTMRRVSRLFTLSVLTLMGTAFHANAEVRYLLVPDTEADRILAFDPNDGHLIHADFIADAARLEAPKKAIGSGRGTILIADQVNDAVYEYSVDGTYIRTLVDNPTHGIDNIRGIAVHNGELYVTVASGPHADTVQRFTLEGSALGTFINANLSSPFDILFRTNDVLVSNSGSDDIERYAGDGTYLGKFVDSDGESGPNAPQQLQQLANGNILVAGFSPPLGIFEYSASGTQLNHYQTEKEGTRGIAPLSNGEILYTVGSPHESLVAAYNPITNTSRPILDGTEEGSEFQYITSVLIRVDVSGTVSLEDCPDADVPLTFELRPADNSASFTRTVTPNPDGTFTVANVPPKDYDIAIKGSKWLQKVVAADGSGGDVSSLNVALNGGDANNDNSVDVFDLAELIESFDAVPGDPNWNGGAADFNCDESVDVFDLDIFIRNFDLSGDT